MGYTKKLRVTPQRKAAARKQRAHTKTGKRLTS